MRGCPGEAGPKVIGGALVFDLEQPRTENMPIHPAHKQAGNSYLLHRHHEDEYCPTKPARAWELLGF